MESAVGTDVLLVTATKVETEAALMTFGAATNPRACNIDGRVYFDLGTVNGARVKLTQSEMGSGGLGGSQQAVTKGISALSPRCVIMVGIAFGVNEVKQRIGDILIAQQLRPYDLQRVGTQTDGSASIILRDDKPHASPWLTNHLKSAAMTWKGAKLRFGTILTGAKLVDNLDFREQLRAFDSEAVGGEMEGAGLYVACHEQKVDWILVKAICDFADGQKAKGKGRRQRLAAKNAVAFVYHSLRFATIMPRGHSNHAVPTGLDRDALLIPQFQSRSEARAWLEEQLLANRVIHSEFGPDADYQFNPESEMASVWRRKVVQHVIPRNRQILAALDINASLLAPHEKVIREIFRQHVDDQEAFHIWGNTTIRKRFPSEVEGLFRD